MKIIFVAILFTADMSGYRDFVGVFATTEQCESARAEFIEAAKKAQLPYVSSCAKAKGGIEV